MTSKRGYILAKGVQVRKEIFGLLFYDYRGPRLYFVPSKDLLPDAFFDGKQSIKDLADIVASSSSWSCKQIQDHLKKILKTLEGKGLVYGQPIY